MLFETYAVFDLWTCLKTNLWVPFTVALKVFILYLLLITFFIQIFLNFVLSISILRSLFDYINNFKNQQQCL